MPSDCVACRPSISITDELVFGIYPGLVDIGLRRTPGCMRNRFRRGPRETVHLPSGRNVAIEPISVSALTAVVPIHGDIAHVSRSDSVHEEPPGSSDKRERVAGRTYTSYIASPVRMMARELSTIAERYVTIYIVPVGLIVRRGRQFCLQLDYRTRVIDVTLRLFFFFLEEASLIVPAEFNGNFYEIWVLSDLRPIEISS